MHFLWVRQVAGDESKGMDSQVANKPRAVQGFFGCSSTEHRSKTKPSIDLELPSCYWDHKMPTRLAILWQYFWCLAEISGLTDLTNGSISRGFFEEMPQLDHWTDGFLQQLLQLPQHNAAAHAGDLFFFSAIFHVAESATRMIIIPCEKLACTPL